MLLTQWSAHRGDVVPHLVSLEGMHNALQHTSEFPFLVCKHLVISFYREGKWERKFLEEITIVKQAFDIF